MAKIHTLKQETDIVCKRIATTFNGLVSHEGKISWGVIEDLAQWQTLTDLVNPRFQTEEGGEKISESIFESVYFEPHITWMYFSLPPNAPDQVFFMGKHECIDGENNIFLNIISAKEFYERTQTTEETHRPISLASNDCYATLIPCLNMHLESNFRLRVFGDSAPNKIEVQQFDLGVLTNKGQRLGLA
jgi:hypothetical protein